MKRILKYALLALLFLIVDQPTMAQMNKWNKSEKSVSTVVKTSTDTDQKKIPATLRLGVMLPLHNVNGDGRRMVEYYRGILMACDSLKRLGVSTDVYAWNLAEESNVETVLEDPNAARCDIIFGPLYSKQVPQLAKFVKKHDIRLVIPFSIVAPDLYTNEHIYQVYQPQGELINSTVRRFCDWFRDYHPVIVDCGDSTSTKGAFTSALRGMLENRGITYSLTSLKNSSDEAFYKAFDKTKKNVVVLNTSRSPELNATFGRLSALTTENPDVHVAMFGYTEWLMYTQHQLDNFYKYNVYLPAPFYTNFFSAATERLQQRYRWNFHQDMMQSLPRFALTGFDHAYFFLLGIHKEGKKFDGTNGSFLLPPVQTPLKFEKLKNGGYQNRAYMFIHYMPEHQIEALNY